MSDHIKTVLSILFVLLISCSQTSTRLDSENDAQSGLSSEDIQSIRNANDILREQNNQLLENQSSLREEVLQLQEEIEFLENRNEDYRQNPDLLDISGFYVFDTSSRPDYLLTGLKVTKLGEGLVFQNVSVDPDNREFTFEVDTPIAFVPQIYENRYLFSWPTTTLVVGEVHTSFVTFDLKRIGDNLQGVCYEHGSSERMYRNVTFEWIDDTLSLTADSNLESRIHYLPVDYITSNNWTIEAYWAGELVMVNQFIFVGQDGNSVQVNTFEDGELVSSENDFYYRIAGNEMTIYIPRDDIEFPFASIYQDEELVFLHRLGSASYTKPRILE